MGVDSDQEPRQKVKPKMRLALDIAIVALAPGGLVYGAWRLMKYIRGRRVRTLSAREVMDRMAEKFPDDEWRRLYKEATQVPEVVYEDRSADTGWKTRVKLMMQTRWPRA